MGFISYAWRLEFQIIPTIRRCVKLHAGQPMSCSLGCYMPAQDVHHHEIYSASAIKRWVPQTKEPQPWLTQTDRHSATAVWNFIFGDYWAVYKRWWVAHRLSSVPRRLFLGLIGQDFGPTVLSREKFTRPHRAFFKTCWAEQTSQNHSGIISSKASRLYNAKERIQRGAGATRKGYISSAL